MNTSPVSPWGGAAAASRSGALDQRFALDVQGVDALRRTVRNSPEEGLKQVSRQFEALFMNMVLKSMREATPSSGLFESQSEKVYTSMLDQQLTQSLSGRGLGLAEAMLAQLSRGNTPGVSAANASGPPSEAPLGLALKAPSAMPLGGPLPQGALPSLPPGQAASSPNLVKNERSTPSAAAPPSVHVDNFVARMGASARAASAACGVPAPLILAQAALESGWGRREIRGDDGSQSFNLFGIKADRSWQGPAVEITTTEYVDGAAQSIRAKFRAYGSYEEAFTDYARFMTRNPRYANVLATANPTEAAHGLQRAGYATDPQYANKLVRIMQKFA